MGANRSATGGEAMGTENAAAWRTTVADIEQAIGDCLSALDRYEAAFVQVLGGASGVATDSPPAAHADRGEGWGERLDVAGRSADEVERLLDEQEAIWGRWRKALSGWQRLAAAGPGTAAAAAASNGEGGS
jgi:hypothetical protein